MDPSMVSVGESKHQIKPDFEFIRDEDIVDDRVAPENAFETTESTTSHNSNRLNRTGEPTRINNTSWKQRRADCDYRLDE